MQTFKQFLNEIMDVDFFVSLINKAARDGRLRLDVTYDAVNSPGKQGYKGTVISAKQVGKFFVQILYHKDTGSGTSVLDIDDVDVTNFFITKVDGRPTLQKRAYVPEQDEINAKDERFLTEIVDLPLLMKLINAAASQKPRLLLDCNYDGHHHYGFVEEARSQPRREQEPLFALIDYRFWSEEAGEYVPATMDIYEEDVSGFYFGKSLDDDGRTLRRALMYRKPDTVTESREVYAKKIENAPDWSPAHAEADYKVGSVTFSASSGLGAVPFNQSVYYHGLVALVRPSKFARLALPLDASPGAIESMVEKVNEGYALGIPFLQIDLGDYWKNPKTGLPKVKGHEGRHRVQAFAKIEGDKELPVHLFLMGGDRNRDLTPDALKAIRDAVIGQRGDVVLDPFKRLWDQPQ